MDGLPILVVTHQLQVERRTGKVRQSETDVLPLCHATNLITLRYLKNDLINIGSIRILYLTFEHKQKELEVAVRFRDLISLNL